MKKILAKTLTITALAVTLTLTGCSSSTDHMSEAEFLQTLRDKAPSLASANDASLIKIGKEMCTVLSEVSDANTSVARALSAAKQAGLSNAESADLITASAWTFCPDQESKITNYGK